jgi:hypothetical protein
MFHVQPWFSILIDFLLDFFLQNITFVILTQHENNSNDICIYIYK